MPDCGAGVGGELEGGAEAGSGGGGGLGSLPSRPTGDARSSKVSSRNSKGRFGRADFRFGKAVEEPTSQVRRVRIIAPARADVLLRGCSIILRRESRGFAEVSLESVGFDTECLKRPAFRIRLHRFVSGCWQ